MTKEIIGHGRLFELGPELGSEPRELDLDARWAVSSMIKHLSDTRSLQPDSVSEAEFRSLTPEKIEEGLYVPEGMRDRDFPRARNGVIFPPEEYQALSISPIRIARKAGNDYVKKYSSIMDKERLAEEERRESARALDGMIAKTGNLEASLMQQAEVLDAVLGELMSARGTGFFAHLKAVELKMKVVEAEMSIRKALEVSAQTKGWSRQKTERALATLDYQLFGPHDERFKKWKLYAPMAKMYAVNRGRVVGVALTSLRKERGNFPEDE